MSRLEQEAHLPWRVPQLVRDRKPERPSIPEKVVAVDPDVALALLIAKAHSEIYEANVDPVVDEFGDVLAVLWALHSRVGLHLVDSPCESVEFISLFVWAGLEEKYDPTPDEASADLHGLVEEFARDMTSLDIFRRLVRAVLARARMHDHDYTAVLEAMEAKAERVGDFRRQLLWIDTALGRSAP